MTKNNYVITIGGVEIEELERSATKTTTAAISTRTVKSSSFANEGNVIFLKGGGG